MTIDHEHKADVSQENMRLALACLINNVSSEYGLSLIHIWYPDDAIGADDYVEINDGVLRISAVSYTHLFL